MAAEPVLSGAAQAAKRLLDLVGSASGLVVLAPLFVVVGLAIRIESPGPAFFRQERIGRHGRPFRIWKFRTMTIAQDPSAPQITVAGDRRITRLGAILRQYKLDELPQLINVLVGEMSLVGPRPEVPKYVAIYPPELKRIVLSVRPGITDLASLEFRDENELLQGAADPENVYRTQVMPRKLELCRTYVEHWSFWQDLKLIARTVLAMAR